MHDGCLGSFENGKQIVDKVRMMGFSNQRLPIPMTLNCHGCGSEFTMETFEQTCPECDMVYAVTPCHAFDVRNIMSAGKNY